MLYLTVYLILVCGVAAEDCTRGPYLFDDSCAIVSQGIGSSINRMKYGLLMSSLYNMTYVPNRKCFQSKEHHTDLYDYFGWENHLDCTYRQVLDHTHSRPIVKSIVGETSSSDGDGSGNSDDGSGSHIHLQKLARLRDANSPAFANKSHKLVLVPVHYSNQKEVEAADNYELDTLCTILSHLRPALNTNTASMVNYFRPGNEQKAGKILSKLEDLSSKEKMQNRRTLFTQLHKARAEVAQFEAIDNTKVVYLLKAPRLIEGYRCTADYIYQHWRNVPSRTTTARTAKPIREKVVLAFNFRHGDVATKDINWIDPQYETRTIPLKQGVDVMNALFSEASVLYKKQHLVDVHFYSEGNRNEFQLLIDAFPDIRMHLGDADSTADDIDGMSQADILLTSPSSFCALIASLNRNGVILIDNENTNKFDGISTLKQQNILNKDLVAFNKQLCAAKLYAASTVKEQICGKSETSIPAASSSADSSQGSADSNVKEEGTSDKSRQIFNAYRRVLSALDASETTTAQGFSLPSLVSALKAEPDLRGIMSALVDAQPNSSVSCYRDPMTAYSRDYYIQGSVCRTNKYIGPRMVYKQGDVGLTPATTRHRRKLQEQVYTVDGKKADRSLDLSLAYITRLVADAIIQAGFQMSTYVVFGGNIHRRERLVQHLAHSGIAETYSHWIDVYKSDEITAEVKATHFKNDNDASKARCIEVFEMDRACGKAVKGYDFSKTEMSVALKHMTIMKELHALESKRREVAKDDTTMLDSFVLVIEDDQFLPLDIRRQVVELLLQAPSKLSSVMLDDSFFWIPGYAPPPRIGKFVFPRSYYRDNTRTVGAYLIRYSAAHGIIENHSFIPAYVPIDHQLKYALRSNQQLIHWAYPPLTCAGSQGLEGLHTSATGGTQMDPGDRIACMHCCDRFYNMTTMDNLYQFALR